MYYLLKQIILVITQKTACLTIVTAFFDPKLLSWWIFKSVVVLGGREFLQPLVQCTQ
jgi:hypothetical protein